MLGGDDGGFSFDIDLVISSNPRFLVSTPNNITAIKESSIDVAPMRDTVVIEGGRIPKATSAMIRTPPALQAAAHRPAPVERTWVG